MKALKSALAKELLANRKTADELRRAVEFVVSSKSQKTADHFDTLEYINKKGTSTKIRARIVSATS